MRGQARKRPTRFGSGITRRDFLNGATAGSAALLGAPLAPLASDQASILRPSLAGNWYGYGGVGPYATSHGNTPEVVAAAHRLRDGEATPRLDAMDAVYECDLAIVGGGMAGLGAALEFMKTRGNGQTCILLDNHPMVGGEAKENEFSVDGQRLIAPQGANGFFLPPRVDSAESATGDARYYADLNIERDLVFADWPASKKPLRFCRDNYGYLVAGLQKNTSVGHYYNGQWVIDMWQNRLAHAALDSETKAGLLNWFDAGAERDFATDEQALRQLDTLSYENFLTKVLKFDKSGARYADLFLASACGLGSDAVSAYAAHQLPMPGLFGPMPDNLQRVSFPGGNSGFVRHFLKRLIPDSISGSTTFEDILTGTVRTENLDREGQPLRIRLSSTVLNVRHEGPAETADQVVLTYVQNGRHYAIKAKAVVMATGSWMNRYVVEDMPDAHREASEQFIHAPFLVANVALTNWRFLYKLGITAAIWDPSSGGFGYTCNMRNPMQVGQYQPPLDPDKPMVLSFYTPFFYPGLPAAAQVTRGRMELLTTSFPDYEKKILTQMMTLFSSAGFDPQRDVAGLILNRWGHAYSVPYPGFYGGATGKAPRDVLRQHYGRIAFAHSELDGLQHFGPAADEGRRAANQLRNAL